MDLEVRGEIHGLLGENGAGKSTLMNVLAGVYQPRAGEMLLDGRRVRVPNARAAMNLGIRFIHQELNLCLDLNVFENMYLGQELRQRSGLLDKKRMADNARAVFERMQVPIDPWATVEDLQTAEKQLVEIARALLFDSELIIMDEPTSVSNQEIDSLFTSCASSGRASALSISPTRCRDIPRLRALHRAQDGRLSAPAASATRTRTTSRR